MTLRLLALMVPLSGCWVDETPNGGFQVSFLALPDGGVVPPDGIIPYFPGGPFTVLVQVPLAQFVGTTRASVQIVEPEPALPTGSTGSATATLVPQDGGIASGAANLSWPPGGPVDVLVQAAGFSQVAHASLQVPNLIFAQSTMTPLQNGIQESYPLCIESTSVNGSVNIHANNAVLQSAAGGSSSSDSMLPLQPGACTEIFPAPAASANVISHAFVIAVPITPAGLSPPALAPAFDVIATLSGTTVVRTLSPSTAPLHLANVCISAVNAHDALVQSCSGSDGVLGDGGEPVVQAGDGGIPSAGTIVNVTVYVTLADSGAPVPGVTVTYKASSSSVLLIPDTVITDANGYGSTHFEMPSSTSTLTISAAVGSSRAGIAF